MAQYLLKQDWMLLPIPDDMSYEHAAMACCGLGPTFGAFQTMGVDRYDTVLITGLGPVGLGGVINAVYRGARVIGVDANRYRAKLALELGASAVIDTGRRRCFAAGAGINRRGPRRRQSRRLLRCRGGASPVHRRDPAARPSGLRR